MRKYRDAERELKALDSAARYAKTNAEKNRIKRRVKEICKENNLVKMPIIKNKVEPQGNVVEITARKCHDNIQPKIKVGQRYCIQSRDTLQDGTSVLLLVDPLVSNGKAMRCNAKRFSWRVITDVELKEEMLKKKAQETTDMIMSNFTFEEHMQIAFVPLVIIHCAWVYAERVLAKAASYRIAETKKLARAVKLLKESYDREQEKDLDLRHRMHLKSQGDEFMQEFARDFLIIEFTLRNELLKVYPDDNYIDVRVDAFISLLLCDFHKQQQEDCDKMIAERVGTPQHTVLNPKIDALRTCMDAYTGGAAIDLTGHVQMWLRILANNLKKIEFTLED